jgi:hypothetical protein
MPRVFCTHIRPYSYFDESVLYCDMMNIYK